MGNISEGCGRGGCTQVVGIGSVDVFGLKVKWPGLQREISQSWRRERRGLSSFLIVGFNI
jgi:hypothetical protein